MVIDNIIGRTQTHTNHIKYNINNGRRFLRLVRYNIHRHRAIRCIVGNESKKYFKKSKRKNTNVNKSHNTRSIIITKIITIVIITVVITVIIIIIIIHTIKILYRIP